MNKFIKVRTNMIWQGVYQVVILVLGFIVPYMVLNVYGSEVNGLTSTIKQIILLSSLASAGITTAATYTLYKPVQENDCAKIAGVLESVKKSYKYITIITGVVCLLSSVILAFFQKGSLSPILVFVACILTSMNTLLDLYFTATTSVFLTATQDKHILSIGMLIAGVIMYMGQILVCVLNLHFIFLYATSVVGCIFKVIYLNICFNKRYSKYKIDKNIKHDKGEFSFRSVGYAFANEVSHTVNVASQSIILSLLYGLAEASVLSVYMMVVNSLSLIAQIVYTSFGPSFGAVVAEGDYKKMNDVFEIFQYTIMFLNAFLYMCAVPLILPFVKLYTHNVTDIQYISKILMVECILYGIFYAIRVPYNIVVSTTGQFKKSATQTTLTCVITVVISVLVSAYDYRLILSGSIIFYATNTFYQHYMLKHEVEGFENSHFWKHLMVTVVGILIMFFVSFVSNGIIVNRISQWVIMAMITAGIAFVLLLIISWLVDRVSFKKSFKYFRQKIVSQSR